MNREIKFRAWDKDKNEMYKPIHEAYRGNLFELLVSFSGDLIAHTMKGIEHQSLFPNRFILMQFTGLKDKNGVEVYEGSILKDKVGNLFLVEWDNVFSMFMGNQISDGQPCGDKQLEPCFWDHSEITGNIHENPELLK